MSRPQAPKPAKLVIGLLLNQKSLVTEICADLEDSFGKIEMLSDWMDFNYTDYYAPEMGRPLYRRMLVFKSLIEQQALAGIKVATNEIEKHYAVNGQRQVNIDPGYLLYERFVLATGKNYAHRIYIGEHIYADLTLIYERGTYRPLPWTYPDYADTKMISFLTEVREKYGADLRSRSRSGDLPDDS